MTQPRKEQINDIQAKFSALDPRLTSVTAPPTAGQPLGLVQSTTYTPPGSTFNPLSVFLASTVSGTFGGVVDISPGYVMGQIQGPFVAAAGNQISLIIPGLFSGNPMFVTILASDIVNLGGTPLLTTSRLAARINQALNPYLTTAGFPGFPVATNVNGYLWLTTPTNGDAASITVRDVTAGRLDVFFGPGSSPSLNGVGSTAPKRGIATVAPDGLGGRCQTRLADGQAAVTRQTARIHMGDGFYVPDNAIGQEIHAKVTAVPNKSATVSFYTFGKLRPRVTTASSNFASLNATDTLTISIVDPNLPPAAAVNVNFAPPPATVQDVIDKINAAWLNGVGAGVFATAIRAVAVSLKQLYNFPDGCRFVLRMNSSPAVVVTLNSAVKTQADLAAAINAAIVGAGQGAVGSASSGAGGVMVFGCTSTVGTAQLVLSAGAPSSSFLPADMRALNEMGISPGMYQASAIARLYGQDEIVIYNPSRSTGAAISVSGSVATLTKMGLPGPVSVGVTLGEEPAIPGSEVRVLIPEAMEFGEVPDNQDAVVEQFLTPARASFVDPTKGIANAGFPLLINQDGTVPVDVIPKIFDALAIDTLSLGTRLLGSVTDLLRSRLNIPFSSTGYTLLETNADAAGTSPTIRRYVSANGILLVTVNAVWDNSLVMWRRDTTADASAVRVTTSSMIKQAHPVASSAAWTDGAWLDVAAIGPTSSTAGLTSVGFGHTDQPLVPRQTIGAGAGIFDMTLLQEVIGGNGIGLRTYYFGSDGARLTTRNAKWNGGAYVKDIPGAQASADYFGSFAHIRYFQQATDDGPWFGWTEQAFAEGYNPASGSSHQFGGRLILGTGIQSTSTGRVIPRLRTTHLGATTNTRTLISQWDGGSGINFYLYRGTGFNGGAADVLIQSCNAYWDEVNGLWHKENAGNNSHLIIWSGSIVEYYFKGGNSPFSWPDSTWHVAHQMTRNGVVLPYSEDPYNTIGQANLIQAGNIPKAWGSATFARDASGVQTITAYDSYNVSSWVQSGTYGVLANLYAAFGSSDFVVVATSFFDIFSGKLPSSTVVTGTPNNSSSIYFSAYPAGSSSAVNLNSNSTYVSVQFVAFGRQ